MPELYVALGSNVGDSAEHLRAAVGRLAKALEIEAVSSLYRTEPVGLSEQPWFLNAVLRARTEMSPREVLALLREVEDERGRQRDVPLGPRTLDLDLLVYDDLSIDEPELTLPHPRMSGRRFVLEPLAEIAPGLRPGKGAATTAELLSALPTGESVERVDLPGWPPRA